MYFQNNVTYYLKIVLKQKGYKFLKTQFKKKIKKCNLIILKLKKKIKFWFVSRLRTDVTHNSYVRIGQTFKKQKQVVQVQKS